tara:strand:- start:120 stop:755 length:636 start_codon:yes stop_codon:yes gene_type:complete
MKDLAVKSKISKIIDFNSYKNNDIIFSYSFLDNKNFCVLHIYNPNREELVVNKQNEKFYKTVADMLFVQDINNKEKGCFNHQRNDDDILYNESTTLSERLNSFLAIQYTFILIDLKNNFEPVSLFCLVDNYIYDVCTSYHNRNMGYMTKMMIHFFKLVKKNKLKNGKHKNIVLDVVKVNPDFQKVRDYYEKRFSFKFSKELPEKIILEKQI